MCPNNQMPPLKDFMEKVQDFNVKDILHQSIYIKNDCVHLQGRIRSFFTFKSTFQKASNKFLLDYQKAYGNDMTKIAKVYLKDSLQGKPLNAAVVKNLIFIAENKKQHLLKYFKSLQNNENNALQSMIDIFLKDMPAEINNNSNVKDILHSQLLDILNSINEKDLFASNKKNPAYSIDKLLLNQSPTFINQWLKQFINLDNIPPAPPTQTPPPPLEESNTDLTQPILETNMIKNEENTAEPSLPPIGTPPLNDTKLFAFNNTTIEEDKELDDEYDDDTALLTSRYTEPPALNDTPIDVEKFILDANTIEDYDDEDTELPPIQHTETLHLRQVPVFSTNPELEDDGIDFSYTSKKDKRKSENRTRLFNPDILLSGKTWDKHFQIKLNEISPLISTNPKYSPEKISNLRTRRNKRLHNVFDDQQTISFSKEITLPTNEILSMSPCYKINTICLHPAISKNKTSDNPLTTHTCTLTRSTHLYSDFKEALERFNIPSRQINFIDTVLSTMEPRLLIDVINNTTNPFAEDIRNCLPKTFDVDIELPSFEKGYNWHDDLDNNTIKLTFHIPSELEPVFGKAFMTYTITDKGLISISDFLVRVPEDLTLRTGLDFLRGNQPLLTQLTRIYLLNLKHENKLSGDSSSIITSYLAQHDNVRKHIVAPTPQSIIKIHDLSDTYKKLSSEEREDINTVTTLFLNKLKGLYHNPHLPSSFPPLTWIAFLDSHANIAKDYFSALKLEMLREPLKTKAARLEKKNAV